MGVDAKLLAGHEFFRGMQGGHLSVLATTATPVVFPEGHRIFREGASADRFWALLSGQVRLDLLTPGRGHIPVDFFGRGSILGWSWLFPPRTWRFGATATMPVTALEFDAALVRTHAAANPSLGAELNARFTQVILGRLQATRIRLIDAAEHRDTALEAHHAM
ncbi:Crp/Fnr family transcriptional regulator [Actinocorallia sp. A-T 12471]|uniref:cyclic nucleotide-binding domain-containing protein n=1 Tax=Actinocorallia sp. A-T 12471 TaxID=3089813 RepID=UPI0029CB045F|nr:Crp/Fnr family transcriptional regulator [Actinocorallia sp. A-T 12471]MDX6744339.1 Crp/Fnr family transcriptional regulator [Actinocorallia sp. A-T 12471]